MELGLKGKKVLVQGASSGLGFAIANAYVQEGAIVAISSSSEKKITNAAEKLKTALPFVSDFHKEGAGSALVWQVIEKLGGIDILVTNTTNPPKGEFMDMKVDDWKKGFQSVYLSVVESVLEVIPSMKENGFGRILLSSSVAAKEPISSMTISSSIRSGLLGLSKTLSSQLAPHGITINSLLPGFMATEMVLEKFSDKLQSLEDMIPMKRLGKPEEYAKLALFLSSTSSSYITGQSIAIDGGLSKGI